MQKLVTASLCSPLRASKPTPVTLNVSRDASGRQGGEARCDRSQCPRQHASAPLYPGHRDAQAWPSPLDCLSVQEPRCTVGRQCSQALRQSLRQRSYPSLPAASRVGWGLAASAVGVVPVGRGDTGGAGRRRAREKWLYIPIISGSEISDTVLPAVRRSCLGLSSQRFGCRGGSGCEHDEPPTHRGCRAAILRRMSESSIWSRSFWAALTVVPRAEASFG